MFNLNMLCQKLLIVANIIHFTQSDTDDYSVTVKIGDVRTVKVPIIQCYWTHWMIGQYLIAMFKTKGINCVFMQKDFKCEK